MSMKALLLLLTIPRQISSLSVVFFGDPFTLGVGDHLGWLGRIDPWPQPCDGYNLGIRGNTSRQIRTR